MLTFLMTMLLLFFPLTPIMMASLLLLVSLIAGYISFCFYHTWFFVSAIVISFSSGMVIMFFYCSMNSTHELKKSSNWLFFFVLFFFMLISFNILSITESFVMNNTFLDFSYFLFFGCLILLLSMIGINKTFFNPTNSMMHSY